MGCRKKKNVKDAGNLFFRSMDNQKNRQPVAETFLFFFNKMYLNNEFT